MTAELMLIAPIVVPLVAAAMAFLGHDHLLLQRLVTGIALLTVMIAGGVLTVWTLADMVVHTVLGAHAAGPGIALTAEPFGSALVAATGIIATVVITTMRSGPDEGHVYVHPLILVLVGGASGSFLTGDLFNLFVFFEVVLIASYVLLITPGRSRQLCAATVYVTVNLMGTLLFLAGVAAVFATTGTVNLAALARTDLVASGSLPGVALVVAAFTLKAGLLPFSGWLVIGYPAPQRTTTALFAGTLTTVGVAALYRVVLLGFGDVEVARDVVLVTGAATAVVASIAAIATADHGRVLALLITTQVGFMAIGLGLGTHAAVVAGVFFVLQDVVVKTAAVLAYRPVAPDGPAASVPDGLAVASFAVLALSLVGIPPLTGFVGKALLVHASFDAGAPIVAAATLVASVATIAALIPLWQQATSTSSDLAARPLWSSQAVPAAAVAAAAIVVGVLPGWLLTVAMAAADVLGDPSAYATRVLGP